MKTIALADSLGVMILATATALPLGCVPIPTAVKADLQPFIAVTGNYELMVSGPRPTPAPAPGPGPDGCQSGCRCNGTGREPTGDGLATTPCRCPDSCACKAKKQVAATPRFDAHRAKCRQCDDPNPGGLGLCAVGFKLWQDDLRQAIDTCTTGSCTVTRR